MKMASADYKPTLRISEANSFLSSFPMALLSPPLPFFLCTESKRRGRSLKSV